MNYRLGARSRVTFVKVRSGIARKTKCNYVHQRPTLSVDVFLITKRIEQTVFRGTQTSFPTDLVLLQNLINIEQ